MAGIVTKKFKCKVEMAERASATFIRMPFDVKEVFGTGRLPVKLTINDYTYRTTVFHMGGVYGVPLRREHRENAKVKGGDIVQVIVTPDTEPRTVDVPADLKKFLQQNKAWELFEPLSFTHKKEFVQWITGAKKEETREARKQKMVEMLKKKEHL
jgi:bacteriocin resistance YdeI/OmpD-like protein/uncharacterized protein DUF1905